MKIVALGDSITQGFPYGEENSWVHIVSGKYNIPIVNRGVCGDYTSGMLRRFNHHVTMENPDYVIVLGGYNDAFSLYPLDKVSDNFLKICEKAQENGIKPILSLPTPVTIASVETILSEYREWLYDYAQKNKIATINFYKTFFDPENNHLISGTTTDGAHPTIKGYQLMATAVDLNKLLS